MIYHIVLKELVVNLYKVEADSLEDAIEDARTGENILDHYTCDHLEQEFLRCENLEQIKMEIS